MIKHGNPPYLECSSKGDTRFSAFFAKVKSKGNKSIEELYQGFKKFEDGSTGLTWKEAKGRKAVNQEEANKYYTLLWKAYMLENPALIDILVNVTGVSDIFGQEGHCCQATELWNMREYYIQRIKPLRVIIGGDERYGYVPALTSKGKTPQELSALIEQCHRNGINSITGVMNQTKWNVETVLSSVTKGAAFIGEQWALRNGMLIEQYPQDIEKFGDHAPYVTNKKMIDNADALLAFQELQGDNRVTKHLIEAARAKGLLVYVVQF